MRVVIVGASGNVGTAVLRRLNGEEDVDLVGVVRQVPPPDAPAPYDRAVWHAVDVAQPSSVAALTTAFAGADAVIHLPWLLQPNHDERLMAATNIDGLKHVLAAVVAAGVAQVVVASSVGAYSPGPKKRRVDETWPTGGLATSHYARHKAVNERILDRFELDHPSTVVTRLRPGLVMHGVVGDELRAFFMGPLIPVRWLGRIPLPVVPIPVRTISQVVHADDLADAFARVVLQRAGGAFNIATEPVIGPQDVASILGGRWLPVRIAPVRGLVWLLWHLRLLAADPGWIDIATSVPIMSTEKARTELGWAPRKDGIDAVAEAVRGVSDRTTSAGSPHLGGTAKR